MKRTEIVMGMPITVVIPERERDPAPRGAVFATTTDAAESLFAHFRRIDERFSPYIETSETARIDRGVIDPREASPEMSELLRLAEQTRAETGGYFDVNFGGRFDPSGLVKGWAIRKAARILDEDGFHSFCIEAGGDIETRGANEQGAAWTIGIRSPFHPEEIVRTVRLHDAGIATSGTYIRGEHIYNPLTGGRAREIASLTVVGPDVYEADRLATACFAMGLDGIAFLAGQPGVEGYMIGHDGVATYTPGFARYIAS